MTTSIQETNQNTQEAKNKHFLMSTRQNNLCKFSAYIAFNKAVNGQTDLKHKKDY